VGITPAQALASLSGFKGVKRRMEVRGVVAGVTVYDDFAHHPTAIELTIAGLRQRAPQGRILAVLEPRSNTMKLGVMKARLPASLGLADRVFCYARGLGWDASEALAPLGALARWGRWRVPMTTSTPWWRTWLRRRVMATMCWS